MIRVTRGAARAAAFWLEARANTSTRADFSAELLEVASAIQAALRATSKRGAGEKCVAIGAVDQADLFDGGAS